MCSGTSRFYCFCCPHALCIDCIGASGLVLLRGNNGLCKSCVKHILLAEEKSECRLEGVSEIIILSIDLAANSCSLDHHFFFVFNTFWNFHMNDISFGLCGYLYRRLYPIRNLLHWYFMSYHQDG